MYVFLARKVIKFIIIIKFNTSLLLVNLKTYKTINYIEEKKTKLTCSNTYSRIRKILQVISICIKIKCNISFGSNNFSRLLYLYHFINIFIFFRSHPLLQIFYSLKRTIVSCLLHEIMKI